MMGLGILDSKDEFSKQLKKMLVQTIHKFQETVETPFVGLHKENILCQLWPNLIRNIPSTDSSLFSTYGKKSIGICSTISGKIS